MTNDGAIANLVGHLACSLPFLDERRAAGDRPPGASPRTAQRMLTLARALAACGALPAPFKRRRVFVLTSRRIFQRGDDRFRRGGSLPG